MNFFSKFWNLFFTNKVQEEWDTTDDEIIDFAMKSSEKCLKEVWDNDFDKEWDELTK